MAVTTRDGLVSAVAAGRTVQFQKAAIAATAGFFHSYFRSPGMPQSVAAAPSTTGAALSNSTQGALPIPSPSGTSYITSFEGCSTTPCVMILADRLVEFGGLVANVTTAQAVSALALPARATGATDVELWLEVYTTGGATASASVTASYTNQAGTAGRTATLVGGIGASGVPALRTYQFSLQTGDTGVQSVQSLTLGTSTGTAGNIGLTLRRTLLTGYVPNLNSAFFQGWAETDMQLCPDNACLEILTLSGGGYLLGNFGVSQG